MCCYTHITSKERELILYYRGKNYSISKIAEKLGRNKSTISRELNRNSEEDFYSPSVAQEKYQTRRKNCRCRKKLEDKWLYDLVKDKFLNHQWSPEQIAGRLKKEHGEKIISYNTIYRGIYEGLFNEPGLSHGNRGAVRKLRHKGKSRHTKNYDEKRGKIKISNTLEQRPKEAEYRTERGHWEADTVLGQHGKSCLVTLVDRKTRFLTGGKAEFKRSEEVKEVMIKSLKKHPHKTITPDRGKEFARHEEVTKQLDQVQFYFPQPHHPWDRGLNENTNGLIREYIPKGFNIDQLTGEEVQLIYDELNMRPRKCLDYKTPFEDYYSESLHLT